MTQPLSIPRGIDIATPNIARIYDFLLGGSLNFAADRAAAEGLLKLVPGAADSARASRAFLGRVVRYLLGQGIRQFIDMGTGLPTEGHVHHVLREAGAGARVVYIDNDPIVLAHSRALLARENHAAAILADIREPSAVLSHPDLTSLINLAEPVAVLLFAILDHLPDEAGPQAIVASIRDAVAPGSYFAFSHGLDNGADPEDHEAARQLLARTRSPFTLRTPDQVLALASGLDLVKPGLVWVPVWHPDDSPRQAPDESFYMGMVARKPAAT